MNKLLLPICVFLLTYMIASLAFAKDGWDSLGRPHVCDMPSGPRLTICQEWIQTVKRPDITREFGGARCCGDGDAYIADNFRVVQKEGKVFAIISADYFNLDGTIFLKKDEEVEIPANKVNSLPEDANRSGHGVLFLNNFTKEVLCWFFPPLT